MFLSMQQSKPTFLQIKNANTKRPPSPLPQPPPKNKTKQNTKNTTITQPIAATRGEKKLGKTARASFRVGWERTRCVCPESARAWVHDNKAWLRQ